MGTGEEIYEHPRTRFVAEFMGVNNFIEVSCTGRSSDGQRFQTASGVTLWANHTADLAEGVHATLAVRPEAVRLSLAPPEPEPQNLLAGVVEESIYEGDSRRWSVALESGQRLVAREPAATGSRAVHTNGVERGARVYLSWEPAMSLVFSGEASA